MPLRRSLAECPVHRSFLMTDQPSVSCASVAAAESCTPAAAPIRVLPITYRQGSCRVFAKTGKPHALARVSYALLIGNGHDGALLGCLPGGGARCLSATTACARPS